MAMDMHRSELLDSSGIGKPNNKSFKQSSVESRTALDACFVGSANHPMSDKRLDELRGECSTMKNELMSRKRSVT